ncbi:MAG: T9SS type A sorting domain-containing protein [Burkholderiales bacterium]|nr:T9SS type A sorting domain-containing protein [Bacteroidia bacterium]
MKKTLLSLFTILELALGAQTLTQANHNPIPGFNYSTLLCDTSNIFAGTGGINKSWTYTLNASGALSNYTTSTSSNTVFPNANVLVSASSTDQAYYKLNSNVLNYYGGDISFNGVSGSIIYSNPEASAVYPMAILSSTSSAVSGSITSAVGGGNFTGTVSVTADATGSLTVQAPTAASTGSNSSKTFTDVIRLTTVKNINGTISTFFGMIDINMTTKNYDYYSPSASKAPVFSISNNTIITTAQASGTPTTNITKAVTVQKNFDIVSVNEIQKANIELSIFPNPASNFINFSTPSNEATKVTAFDMNGKVVATDVIEMGKAKMNTTNFASGVYMYQVTDKNNQILKTGKFNVSK